MAKTKPVPTTGLTIDQIDAITLQIARAEGLHAALEQNGDDGDDIDATLFPMLREQLEKIKNMVMDCQIGGQS
jgi:hypothetical protein